MNAWRQNYKHQSISRIHTTSWERGLNENSNGLLR